MTRRSTLIGRRMPISRDSSSRLNESATTIEFVFRKRVPSPRDAAGRRNRLAGSFASQNQNSLVSIQKFNITLFNFRLIRFFGLCERILHHTT